MRKMKDSGIAWIGEIPEDWEVKKLKYCVMLRNECRKPISAENRVKGKYDYYGASGVIDKVDKYTIEDKVLLIAEDGANLISRNIPLIYKLDGKAWVNNHAHIMKVRVENDYDYMYYLLENIEYDQYVTGSAQPKLSQENLLKVTLACPLKLEQQKVANFLDEKSNQIDSITEKTSIQIKKLKEYKQALITETVTKGLLKNVKMKDSGIEWIGEIPEHWEVRKMKALFSLKGRIGWQGLTTKDYKEKGAYLITGTDFKNGVIDWEKCVRIDMDRFEEAPDIHVCNKDILITKDGTIGKVAVMKDIPKKVSVNSGVLVIREKEKTTYNCDYLYRILISEIFWRWFKMTSNAGSTIIHLYQGEFSEFKIPTPTFSEQQQIAIYLNTKCQKIDKIISEKKALITKLEKYKKSLIFEAVTGKIDCSN